MTTRWLAGTLLFALGFGSAVLVRLPAADAASSEGIVDSSLKYIDGADFKLVYPPGGTTDYLVVLSRKPETTRESKPQVAYVSYATGSVAFSKKDLQSLAVYQVTPLIGWKGGAEKSLAPRIGVFRCGRPSLCPLPPDPPPIGNSFFIVKSGIASPGRSQ